MKILKILQCFLYFYHSLYCAGQVEILRIFMDEFLLPVRRRLWLGYFFIQPLNCSLFSGMLYRAVYSDVAVQCSLPREGLSSIIHHAISVISFQ